MSKEGLRKGNWKIYFDDEKQHLISEGRFKDGKEVGVWKFYMYDGSMYKREKCLKRKLKTTLYYNNGEKESKGRAKMDNSGEFLHYYWYGKWKQYSENGKLQALQFYENGEMVKEMKK